MKLVYIMGDRQDHTLGSHILQSPIRVPTKSHVCFYFRKRAFCLDTPVHPQLCPVLTRDPFQIFPSFFFHRLGNIKPFCSFFHWSLTVIPFDTLCFIGTACTLTTFVDGCGPLITRCCFFLSVISPLDIPDRKSVV